MDNIDLHISKNKDILENYTISPQQRRHIESELKDLEEWKEDHPDDSHDPTTLELFCHGNPDAPECRIYEN